MPRILSILLVIIGLLILYVPMIQAEEDCAQSQSDAPAAEVKDAATSTIEGDRQAVLDTEKESWSNIKALWG